MMGTRTEWKSKTKERSNVWVPIDNDDYVRNIFERRERCSPEWLSAVVAAVEISRRGIVRSQ